MYIHIALLASFVLIYNLFAEKIEKTAINGPLLYLIFGFAIGPLFLDVFDIQIEYESYMTLAELALALVLFTDASNANISVLKKNIKIPSKLLLIGLPITILFGYLAGVAIFDGFGWIELAILATALAPTDAALGKSVATNPKVPSKIRESLNVESGLNDGICVPVLLLFMALFSSSTRGSIDFEFSLSLFLKQIGYGVLIGGLITFVGAKLITYSTSKNWINGPRKAVIILGLSFTCFALAQWAGGSGFIACFSGGLLYGAMHMNKNEELVEAAEGLGDTLGMVTWIIFGSAFVSEYIYDFSKEVVFYAILSLTFVRMVPVFLVLFKSGFSPYEKLFSGWFGPRGLASIVFAVMILDLELPHEGTIILTMMCTVFLSVVLHGITAKPFISLLTKKRK